MNSLNFSENITRLRREKKLTQEQLADFIGVTKASVSKWETAQSLPDILLLPQLAAFFNVTVDELLGYQPQLSREQIQKIYYDLAADFAASPFEETMNRSRKLVKKYYSCFPFLFQICALWLNHFMLAADPALQKTILSEASDLCDHILADCRDLRLCNDTILLKSQIDLLLGRSEQVIAGLEDIMNPCRLTSQSDGILPLPSWIMADFFGIAYVILPHFRFRRPTLCRYYISCFLSAGNASGSDCLRTCQADGQRFSADWFIRT